MCMLTNAAYTKKFDQKSLQTVERKKKITKLRLLFPPQISSPLFLKRFLSLLSFEYINCTSTLGKNPETI